MSDPVLFELGYHAPAWYTPSKFTPKNNARVARGLHPFGFDLGPPETTCGTCVHLERNGMRSGRVYLKCGISNQTRGPTTDIRAKWRGCEKFTAAPSGKETP